MGDMRWDGLFDDLEAQAAELERAERAAEVETRTRGAVGELTVVDRLRAAVGTALRLRVTGGLAVTGTLRRVGPDWLLVDEDAGREAVIATAHLVTVRGLGRLTAVPGSQPRVESRLGLRSALRGLARDRAAVRLYLADTANGAGAVGTPSGATVLDVTIDRVGRDFVEVALHAPGEARRRTEVRAVDLVPITAVAALRRAT